jgi:hypothetical protein
VVGSRASSYICTTVVVLIREHGDSIFRSFHKFQLLPPSFKILTPITPFRKVSSKLPYLVKLVPILEIFMWEEELTVKIS